MWTPDGSVIISEVSSRNSKQVSGIRGRKRYPVTWEGVLIGGSVNMCERSRSEFLTCVQRIWPANVLAFTVVILNSVLLLYQNVSQ